MSRYFRMTSPLDRLMALSATRAPYLLQSPRHARRLAFQWVRTVRYLMSPEWTLPRFWIGSWEWSGFLYHPATDTSLAWSVPDLRTHPDAWRATIRLHRAPNLHNTTGGPTWIVTLSELPEACHRLLHAASSDDLPSIPGDPGLSHDDSPGTPPEPSRAEPRHA